MTKRSWLKGPPAVHPFENLCTGWKVHFGCMAEWHGILFCCSFKVVLNWRHWFLKQFFIKKHHTGPCSVTVARSATNWEVTGSNPVVDVDRCCLSPNGFEGASLLNFLLEKIVPGPCGATATRSACNREVAGLNPVTVKLHLFWLIHPQTELSWSFLT